MQGVGKRASPVRENQGSLQNLAENPEIVPESATEIPVPEMFPESAVLQTKQMRDHRLFLKVNIFQQVILALIDTGAARTYMGTKVLKIIKRNKILPVHSNSSSVQLAEGSVVQTLGLYQFPICIQQHEVQLECQLLPSLTSDLIIGLDFLELHLISLNLGRRTLVLRSEEIQLESNIQTGLAGIHGPTESQLEKLNQFIDKHLIKQFRNSPGITHTIEHTITLKPGAEPKKQRYYPRNPAIQGIINQEVDQMLADGVIEPSNSPWSSPIVLVKKPSGKYRFCVDRSRLLRESCRG
uniref:Uncharacterized protein n=1 Tax=Photinus pyralis TaxID=7054 RepID=A0A1Y1JZI4_PHOPY